MKRNLKAREFPLRILLMNITSILSFTMCTLYVRGWLAKIMFKFLIFQVLLPTNFKPIMSLVPY